jgi:hypothetical protein
MVTCCVVQAFVNVALVLAERSLFLPSLGAAILITELLSAALLWLSTPHGYHAMCLASAASPLPTFDGHTVADHTRSTRVVDVDTPEGSVASATAEPAAVLRQRRPRDGTSGSIVAATASSQAEARAHGVSSPVTVDASEQRAEEPLAGQSADCHPQLSSAQSDVLWGKAKTAAVVLVTCLCAAYACQTVARNADWRTEESLMLSSLPLYPNNPMTLYGLGCVIHRHASRCLRYTCTVQRR